MITAFSKRGRAWARMLSLLLLCNSFLHLYCHEHLGEAAETAQHGCGAVKIGVSAETHRHAAALTAEFFCPCCSAALDWFADTAAPETGLIRERTAEPQLISLFPGAAVLSTRRSRAPPLA